MTGDPLRDALVAALGAQYDVLRLIGKGGMGAVYLGQERLLDRPVAIKVLPHENADTADARDRFLREARIAARLTHPNVVPLFSFGEAGKTLFYVMGYVDGESLEQRLRRVGKLSFDETRRILGELAGALEHAHALGIVHRDIKPDNVLIETGTGRAVLADFGIARQRIGGASLTRTGMVMGTPHYMSPEQATGEKEIDGRSDLYALGVMGYRMLSGRLPFEGGSMQEIIAQQVTRDPVPLNVLVPDIPADLDVTIARCLAKDPNDRWSSAALMRESLGGGDAALALPDELEKLPASITYYLIVGYFVTWAFAAIAVGTNDAAWAGPIPFAWLGGLLGPAVMFRAARKARVPWKRIWQIALWPPKGWRYWWPRALRRPDDVWDRLPKELRRTRGGMSLFGAFLLGITIPSFVLGMAMALQINDRDAPLFEVAKVFARLGLWGTLVGIIGLLGSYYAATPWLRSLKLSKLDAGKLREEPTAGSRFWKRPEIARLLISEESLALSSAPESPVQIVAAIDRTASSAADPLRAILTDAAAAARDMARAIETIDAELRELAAHDAMAESERLQQKLDALGAQRDSQSTATAHMRQLFASQLELLRDLAERGRRLEERRGRYVELMRTLWLQVSALRSRQAVDAMGVADASGAIRDVCLRAEALQAAAGELPSLPTPESPPTPLPR